MPTASGRQHCIDSINPAAAHETIDLHMVVRNREALQRIDRSIRRRSQENPFGPHIILVDSLSIGRNVLSGLAEFGGMAIGVETVRIPTFLQRVAQAVHRFDGKDPASLPPQLSHQALALAIIAAIPQLTARNADKCVKEIASNIKHAATVSSQLSLASEWARSFDYALRQAADLSAPTVAPWVHLTSSA